MSFTNNNLMVVDLQI